MSLVNHWKPIKSFIPRSSFILGDFSLDIKEALSWLNYD